MMSGLQKYDAKPLKRRSSSPRLMLHDTALFSATWEGLPEALAEDPAVRGRIVETAVGAYLIARGMKEHFDVCWWRDGAYEVDFVVRKEGRLYAIEVKSGRVKDAKGLEEFCRRNAHAIPLIIGDRNLSLETFLKGESTF